MQSLAKRLLQACQTDPEAVIAAIHLFHEGEYTIRHHLSVGVVTALLAQADERISEEEALLLVCAAITHDIGIIHVANNEAKLSDQHKALIQRHPVMSSTALRQAGVTEPLWLQTVEQHHERLDGSGYPQGLSGSAIGLHSRLLAVADVYCAMTRPRPYRPRAYFAMAAMRDLYVGQSQQLDHALIQLLIKTLGLTPPGSLVKLKNGETAVVKKCSTQWHTVKLCANDRNRHTDHAARTAGHPRQASGDCRPG
ncbi:HD domain-containing protein [Paludibacterium sp. dN 18-1]|uniref:HD domain-containing protein n=1 Tax=Paludibacterium denitrificans TaxID=2675226 RepID=A0A844GBN7_9NEIS|nr:HD domain-containing protein [Paludibacterium denitrificans]